MNKYYTGIGSRKTPHDVCEVMSKLAYKLAGGGWKLRSGGADGADTAFENGVIGHFMPWADYAHHMDIYIPWEGFNGRGGHCIVPEKHFGYSLTMRAFSIASSHHGNWGNCSKQVKLLHMRNVFQVLGNDLNTPSKFLVCWAEPSKDGVKGGTGLAWRIAKSNNIPCFNLYVEEDLKRVTKYIG